MSSTRSFAEILDGIDHEISLKTNNSFDAKPLNTETTSIYGFSQILGTTPTYRFSFKSAYLRKATPQNPKRQPHLLNDLQKAALNHFHDLGIEVQIWFNFKELKTAYRQALLKSHPDHGGSSEKFHETRKNYEILSALVTNKA